MDRDRAICERNELLEKYCHEVKDKAEAQKELSQACKDIETVREERDVARKERTEAIIQRDQLLREYYQARQVLTTYGHINDIKECISYSEATIQSSMENLEDVGNFCVESGSKINHGNVYSEVIYF